MTYNVCGGTLNLAQLNNSSFTRSHAPKFIEAESCPASSEDLNLVDFLLSFAAKIMLSKDPRH